MQPHPPAQIGVNPRRVDRIQPSVRIQQREPQASGGNRRARQIHLLGHRRRHQRGIVVHHPLAEFDFLDLDVPEGRVGLLAEDPHLRVILHMLLHKHCPGGVPRHLFGRQRRPVRAEPLHRKIRQMGGHVKMEGNADAGVESPAEIAEQHRRRGKAAVRLRQRRRPVPHIEPRRIGKEPESSIQPHRVLFPGDILPQGGVARDPRSDRPGTSRRSVPRNRPSSV